MDWDEAQLLVISGEATWGPFLKQFYGYEFGAHT